MASVATKPLRIYEGDHGPLKLLAATQRRTQADVVHDALQEYVQRHKETLEDAFKQAQAAIAAGDLDALSAFLDAGAAQHADKQVDRLRSLREV